jgi:putative ABC transport system permease protein
MDGPRWLHALRLRLRALLRRRRADQDLDEELSFHVAMHAHVHAREGLGHADAERQARVAIGGVQQTKERTQDIRPFRWIEAAGQDLRYALRSLRRAPGFATATVLTLALGIGANTAMFSMVSGVILRPLAYPHPEQLMWLTSRFPALPEFWVSVPEYVEFRRLNQSFAEVGAYIPSEVSLTGGDRPRSVRAASVDAHLLRTLGVQPVHGRVFVDAETEVTGPPPTPGQPPLLPAPVAILSYEIWHTAFGGRPLVGQLVEVDGRRCEVIGILAPGADVMDNRTEIWLPLGLNPANRARAAHLLYLVGRLKPHVTPEAAQRELDLLIQTWAARVGVTPGAGAAGHVFAPLNASGIGHILQMKPLQSAVLGTASRAIWVLQACVGLVLLIACANLANLLLARAETRRREFAVRAALGAGRGRLLRQFITEGVLLALLGGGLGLLVARVLLQTLIRAYPTSLPRTSEVAIDPRVLLFTLGLSVATGLLFGLAPFVHTRVEGLAHALKDSGSKGAGGTSRRSVRGLLVMTEVALAVMLVIGAGLLVRSVYNLTSVEAGFDRSRVVTFSMTAPPGHYPRPSARVQLYQRLLDQLRAVPGVQAATAMSGLPPIRSINASDTRIDGYTPTPGGPGENVDYYQNVMSDYFETMGIPIVQGRGFERTDAHAPAMVAVVNETLVRTFWPGQNALGKRLRVCCGDQFPWFTVIGVAKDVKQGGLDRKTGTEFYFFVDQTATVVPPQPGLNLGGFGTMNVVLRTTLPPAALANTITHVVQGVDPSIPVVRFREMNEVFAESITRPRVLAQLVGLFALVALVLAAIGTYGVLAYMVTAQRREIGIRLALGADRARVLTEVMRHGLRLAVIGVMVGVAGALVLNRVIASLLFGVQPTDAATLLAAVPTITLVAALACWLPAWRASRVDPGMVLRDE